VEVIEFITFCLLTFWLGFLTLAGLIFFLLPPPLPPHSFFPVASIRPLGLLFIGLVGAYSIWSAMYGAMPVCIRGCTLRLPSPRLTGAQIVVASCEWFIGAFILSLLLPPNSLPYLHLLGLFLVAHLAGLASQVPGGLGVFESVIIALLPPHIPLEIAAASLILYRCIHNVLPLVTASVLFATREALYGGRSFREKLRMHRPKNTTA
jgi:hypothetical protein